MMNKLIWHIKRDRKYLLNLRNSSLYSRMFMKISAGDMIVYLTNLNIRYENSVSGLNVQKILLINQECSTQIINTHIFYLLIPIFPGFIILGRPSLITLWMLFWILKDSSINSEKYVQNIKQIQTSNGVKMSNHFLPLLKMNLY